MNRKSKINEYLKLQIFFVNKVTGNSNVGASQKKGWSGFKLHPV